jgi:hypothetical protein
MEKPVVSPPLHEFFLGVTRQTFQTLGLGDEAVVGYVAAVLTEFARSDHLYPLRNGRGRVIDGVGELRRATDRAVRFEPNVLRARALRKYVGDYTLFMSGLFRTHVESHGALEHFFEEGQRSYQAVSELDIALFRTRFLFFQHLAENFENYSGALDYMRKAHFTAEPGRSPFAELLRQVKGWIGSGFSDN